MLKYEFYYISQIVLFIRYHKLLLKQMPSGVFNGISFQITNCSVNDFINQNQRIYTSSTLINEKLTILT